jgi:hypothetical protein
MLITSTLEFISETDGISAFICPFGHPVLAETSTECGDFLASIWYH